jgi:hypothetical protein
VRLQRVEEATLGFQASHREVSEKVNILNSASASYLYVLLTVSFKNSCLFNIFVAQGKLRMEVSYFSWIVT